MSRCTDTYGSYIEYLPLPQVVNVLYPKGGIRGGRSLVFGVSTLKVPLGTGKQFQIRVHGKLRS